MARTKRSSRLRAAKLTASVVIHYLAGTYVVTGRAATLCGADWSSEAQLTRERTRVTCADCLRALTKH